MLPRTKHPRTRKLLTVLILVAVALLGTTPTLAKDRNANPAVLPSQSHPHGHSYGEWAARWWQWALGIPTSINPLLDPTGERCAQAQSGHVWFLAGSLGSGQETSRSCTVPTGTALFFPLLNAGYFAFLNDPPETRTEEFLRSQVQCTVPTNLAVEIDGVSVNNPLQYHEESPLFDVQLPEDNLFGQGPDVIPDLLLSPSVDQGYYLFLAPLSPGEHTIHWSGSWSCTFGDFAEDVTYTLTVQARGKA